MNHPTLLRIVKRRAFGIPEEHVLPLPRDDYQVRFTGRVGWVRVCATGEVIYAGVDAVDIVRSAAPF